MSFVLFFRTHHNLLRQTRQTFFFFCYFEVFFLFFSLYDIGLYFLLYIYMCCRFFTILFSHPCVRRNQWGSAKIQTGLLLSPTSEYIEHIWFFHVEKALMARCWKRGIFWYIKGRPSCLFSLLLTAKQQELKIIKNWKRIKDFQVFFAKASEIFNWNSFPI